MNHGMLGHIQEWFHADLLGIQCDPEAVAFKRIVIRPQIVGDLKWARGHLRLDPRHDRRRLAN